MTYLGSEGELQRPGECPVLTLADRVPTLLMRVGGGRRARDRQAVVVDVDGDILGLESGQLECRCHGVGILGFVQVKSGEGIPMSKAAIWQELNELTHLGRKESRRCALEVDGQERALNASSKRRSNSVNGS